MSLFEQVSSLEKLIFDNQTLRALRLFNVFQTREKSHFLVQLSLLVNDIKERENNVHVTLKAENSQRQH